MARLPVCSGEEAIRAFVKAGWRVARQKGSHVSLVKQGLNCQPGDLLVYVPDEGENRA